MATRKRSTVKAQPEPILMPEPPDSIVIAGNLVEATEWASQFGQSESGERIMYVQSVSQLAGLPECIEHYRVGGWKQRPDAYKILDALEALHSPWRAKPVASIHLL